MKYFARILLIFSLILQVAGVPQAAALQLKINQDVNMRSEGARQVIGRLKKGSVVSIPDDVVVRKKNGQVDMNSTIIQWLKTTVQFDSGKRDYFAPVTIVKTEEGSRLPKGNQIPHLALHYLVRTGNVFVLNDDADVQSAPIVAAAPSRPVSNTPSVESTEAQIPSCMVSTGTECQKFEDFLRDLEKPLKRLASTGEHTVGRVSEDLSQLEEVFTRNCGIALKDFIPEMRRQASAEGVSDALMINLMAQESGGRCFAAGDSGRSLGLFQVNLGSTRVKACSVSERVKIQNSKTVEALRSAPQCLQNPVVNLREGIRILRQKFDFITKDNIQIGNTRYSGFDGDRLRKNPELLFKLVLSAYNGGERWVLEAKRDLEQFNRTNDSQLDPYNWQDIRAFYLSRMLPASSQRAYLGEVRAGRRKWAPHNLVYAETIMGLLPGTNELLAQIGRPVSLGMTD